MTEAEWLIGTNPKPMVQFVADKASERKLRLFAVACVASWRGLGKRRRLMYEATEAFAEGTASVEEMRRHWGNAAGSWPERSAVWAVALAKTRSPAQKKIRLALARCVFGNPFHRASLEAGSISSTIKSLAQAAYEERHPSRMELGPTRLAILADALEEAGCTEAALLDHLRSPGPHARGCHAVDSLLGLA